MLSYKEMYDKAVKGKTARQLTPVYLEWKKPEQQMIGAFISRGEVSSSTGGGSYFQYVFETDKGNVKFHMGTNADNDVGAVFVPGVIYSIIYMGKEEISTTRRVNKFIVEEIGPSAAYSGEPSGEA